MPIILKKRDELAWLDNSNKIYNFSFPYTGEMFSLKIYVLYGTYYLNL